MNSAARLAATAAMLLLSACIGACGAERTNQELYGVLSERLGQSLDDLSMVQFMEETFTPGMNYAEVHRTLDEIGANQSWKETTYVDGTWEEVVRVRTGTLSLTEEGYWNWLFIYHPDGTLIRVLARSY